MKGVLSTVDLDDDRLVEKAQASPGLVGRDLVREVVPIKPSDWRDGLWHADEAEAGRQRRADDADDRLHVVALDFGMKWNIPRHLYDQACQVTVLPGTTEAGEVLAHAPDGIFLS